jgi:hypothetical protein
MGMSMQDFFYIQPVVNGIEIISGINTKSVIFPNVNIG